MDTHDIELAGWWGICTSDYKDDMWQMTMFFQNAIITQKFINLCRSKGYRGKTKLDGCKYIVTVTVPAKEKSNFIATWSAMTIDDKSPKFKNQQQGNQYSMTTMDDKSPMPFGKYGPKSKDPRPLGRVPAGYLLWLWEGNGGPELFKQNGGLADYIRQNFSALEQDAPDFIVEQRPDVPRRTL